LAGGIEVKKLLAKGENLNQASTSIFPMNVDIFEKYNPGGGYGSFVMPGMIFLILQQTLLIGIGLLGGTKRENNTFRFYRIFRNTSGGISSLVLGKSLAYVMVYVFNFLLSLVVINHIFVFPFRGEFFNEILLLVPYLFAISFMGLALSTLFKSRVHSLMFLVFMSPILLFLSGLSWPKDSIPQVMQLFASLFPSEYGVPAFLRLRIMGVGFANIGLEYVAILVQMIIYFFIACYAYKRVIVK
jgi:ABC-2 type transport system permease protein